MVMPNPNEEYFQTPQIPPIYQESKPHQLQVSFSIEVWGPDNAGAIAWLMNTLSPLGKVKNIEVQTANFSSSGMRSSL